MRLIGESAFEGCTGLTEIDFPIAMTEIGVRAFYGCSSLSSVTYWGTAEEWSAVSVSNVGNSILEELTFRFLGE
jgi:hypothetical protein